MGEIIQNVEHAHPTFIEEEIVDDVEMAENEVGGKQMKKIENVITDDEINDDTYEQTCSIPRRAVRSHSLVCSKKPFSIVGIGPIPVKEL